MLPVPQIVERPVDNNYLDAAIGAGIDPVVARVLSARIIDANRAPLEILNPTLALLDPPDALPDIEIAAKRIAKAVIGGEIIGINVDFDVDGMTSGAIITGALRDFFGHPEAQLRMYIGHRLKHGYGLTSHMVEIILAESNRANLIITADHGTSDEERIALLTAQGIDVVVSDHHGVPESGHPQSAFACVNPARSDSKFPDKTIAGCYVAFLLMAAVRNQLVEMGHLPDTAPRLTPLLDLACLGTMADCVSLASVNNRAIIRHGLAKIATGARPAWRAFLKKHVGENKVVSKTLSFGIAPRLNSRSRLDDPMVGLYFLLAEDDAEAMDWLGILDSENDKRKEVERNIKDDALKVAETMVDGGAVGLAIFLEDSHPGVHGIVASRVKEVFGRPVAMISPVHSDDPGENGDKLTGSVRGIPGMHTRDALQYIEDHYPELILHYGGHEGAAGFKCPRDSVDQFVAAFDEACRQQLGPDDIGPVIFTDGTLSLDAMTLTLYDRLMDLEPFGNKFDPPIFEVALSIIEMRPVGQNQDHLRFVLGRDGQRFTGIWFSGVSKPIDVELAVGEDYKFAVSLLENIWQGQRSLQLEVHHVYR